MSTLDDDTARQNDGTPERSEQDGPTVAPTRADVRAEAEDDDQSEPPAADVRAP
jgi:hypothetical protein